jgi:hypothetical protein
MGILPWPLTVEIDEDGGVDRRVLRGGRQVAVFVDPERPNRAHPSWVFDERGAVQPDRCPGAVPAHSVLGRHRRDGPAELADLASDLVAGAHGEHLASSYAVELLCPGLPRTARRPTPPATLSDDETARPPEAVLIAQMHLDPVLGFRPLPARRAPRTALGRLDNDHHFADALVHVEHHESGQSEHLLREASTVAHRQGSPSLGVWNHRNDVETPDRVGGCSVSLDLAHSPLIPEEPEKVLQDAGIKLTSVASSVWSKSSRTMIEALIAGEPNSGRRRPRR